MTVLTQTGRLGACVLDPFLHQRSVQFLQGLGLEPLRVEGDIFADERVVLQQVGDRGEARRLGVEGGERLEEEEDFEGSVGRQRRHPPLPVWRGTQLAVEGDGSQDGVEDVVVGVVGVVVVGVGRGSSGGKVLMLVLMLMLSCQAS